MAPSARDRLSVDLRGLHGLHGHLDLKAALLARAKALGVTPSGFVRTALAEALGLPERMDPADRTDRMEAGLPPPDPGTAHHDWEAPHPRPRVRLCLRMRREEAQATMAAARRARMSPGDYIGGLVLGVPVLAAGGSRAELIAGLTASNAELASLSRNIHRLSELLSQADVDAARPYRQMLDHLAVDLRRHLETAATALAALQPQGRPAAVAQSTCQ